MLHIRNPVKHNTDRAILALALLGITCIALLVSWQPAFTMSQAVLSASPRRNLVMPSVAAHEQASLAPELSNKIHVKFAKGSGVRLRNGKFATLANADLSDVRAVLQQFPGIQSERLFSRPELVLAQEKQRIEAKTGQNLPDLNLWYRLILPPGSNAEALVAALNIIPIVEVAYVEPPPAPPPASPNFEPQQGYLNAAPNGIDAAFAQTVAGGDGSGIKIIDIEYGWNRTHEDLLKAVGALIPNKTPAVPDFPDITYDVLFVENHGTAVLGELVADRNGMGVTGIAFGAGLGLVNVYNMEDQYDLADSIDLAHERLRPGDVMLIEQQTSGPAAPCSQADHFVPVEYVQCYFDAITMATSDGIVVVEAAGNGGCDLDDAAYEGKFDRAVCDSGAIIVGAGSAPGCCFFCFTGPHSRLPFSTYGSRVDLQGWGECVVTTGGWNNHDLTPEVTDPNKWYTGTFSGTSSASPVVAGAVAALQGINIQRNGNPLSPAMVRALLVATGTPQDTSTDSGNIGPLPNLRAAATTTLISLTIKKSPVWTGSQAGPQDAGGRFWNEPAFDDSQWSSVTLPNSGLDFNADDRYFRSHFTWDGVSSLSINFATDDGLAVYVNGNVLGSWGNGWRQEGCVNRGSACLIGFSVPAQGIPPGTLKIGDNVLAIDLWNAAVPAPDNFYINVNLTGSTPTPTSTFTVTNTNDSGAGSLRQAISNAASGDTINFSLPVGSTITLTSGELVIEKNLTINGPGANQLTVSGNNLTRVFNIVGNFNVTLSGLTIANGQADDFGGGILNDRGMVNVTNSALSGNSAAISGGGIATTGTMNVTGSTLSGNSATFFGGGIHNLLGTVNVTNSTLSGNSGASFGGAIQSDAGTVNVTNSTLSGNSATSFGGGISNSGALNVSNSTLSGNSAPTSGGIGNLGTVISKSTIIAGNTAGPFGADLSGFFTSQGYNLIGNADGSIGFENGVNNDQVGTGAAPLNPMLGTLANNGGPTQTRALVAGSPGIDKGGPATGVTTDQRGFPRPVDDPAIPNAAGGDGSDIGAFEVQVATPTPTGATLQFSAASYSVNEGGVNATITVTRTGDTSGTATIEYRTTDTDNFTVGCADTVNNLGGAFGRCDFAISLDTLTFASGEPSKTLNVPVIDDSFAEGMETFSLVLSNPIGATLGIATATVTINDNDQVTGANPIFTTLFFVRQHYLDFLSREPEPGEPWTALLNNCSDVNNNPACDRLTVSAAFFGSPEFQLKGYFVYRFYKLAFNRLPLYTEIVVDMRAVTGQTPSEVFQKKATFTNNFVLRPEFVGLYNGQTNTQYVNTLMGRYSLTAITTPDPAAPDGTNKVTLSTADLINRLNGVGGTLTRAQVLRAIADSDQAFNLEFNQAFVAMQYFGYLRRTPEQAGFNAWLNYLNANPTDSRTMVNGFMNSQEYRLRFGPQ